MTMYQATNQLEVTEALASSMVASIQIHKTIKCYHLIKTALDTSHLIKNNKCSTILLTRKHSSNRITIRGDQTSYLGMEFLAICKW